jgi:hypothetical protein
LLALLAISPVGGRISWFFFCLLAGLLLSPASLSASEEVSFGTPEMKLAKEFEKGGRKVLRYEHGRVPEWGYAKPQQDYFHDLPLAGNPGNNPLSPSWAGEAQRRPPWADEAMRSRLSDPLKGDLKRPTQKANS